MANVLVFIDNPGDALKKSSLELLTVGRALGETAVAVNGDVHPAVSAAFAEYGVTAVFQPSAADLDDYLVAPKAAYLAAAAAAAGASTVLLDNSPEGKEIAARLGVSRHTVANHRTRLMRKTGLHRIAQVVTNSSGQEIAISQSQGFFVDGNMQVTALESRLK